MAHMIGNLSSSDIIDAKAVVESNISSIEKTIRDVAGNRLTYPEWFYNETSGKFDIKQVFKIHDDARELMEKENAKNEGPGERQFVDGMGHVSKQEIIKLMCATAMTDYIIAILAISNMIGSGKNDITSLDSNATDIIAQLMNYIGLVKNAYISEEDKQDLIDAQKEIDEGLGGQDFVQKA